MRVYTLGLETKGFEPGKGGGGPRGRGLFYVDEHGHDSMTDVHVHTNQPMRRGLMEQYPNAGDTFILKYAGETLFAYWMNNGAV